VELIGSVDQQDLGTRTFNTIDALQTRTIAFEAYLPRLAAGSHTVTLSAAASGDAGGPLSVTSTLAAIALPAR
jgi:hypothetical protein